MSVSGPEEGLERHCGWPDCPEFFLADVGPSEPGWVRMVGIMAICPRHAPGGHLIRLQPMSNPTASMICECGVGLARWGQVLGSGIRAWKAHVVALPKGRENPA